MVDLPLLKNHGVRQWEGLSHIILWKIKNIKFQTTNQNMFLVIYHDLPIKNGGSFHSWTIVEAPKNLPNHQPVSQWLGATMTSQDRYVFSTSCHRRVTVAVTTRGHLRGMVVKCVSHLGEIENDARALGISYCGWLRNPAPAWMVKTLQIMGCLPPINWCRISQPSTVWSKHQTWWLDNLDNLDNLVN